MSITPEEKHSDVKVVLNDSVDHYACISIIKGQIFHDVSVEGFAEKIAMIEAVEQLLEQLKS